MFKTDMKRILLMLMLAFVALVPAVAQNRHAGKGKRAEMLREMREFKIKFLAQEMDLNAEQKEKFADLYTKMGDERHKLFHETRQLQKRMNESKDASEADYEAAAKALNEARKKDVEIERRYDEQFSRFLTQKQIFKMKAAEEEFRDRMHRMRQDKRRK